MKKTILLVVLFALCASRLYATQCMTVPWPAFATGSIIQAGAVNVNNGYLCSQIDSIDNDNVSAAAGIVDTKLATISTAGKVNSTAMVGTEWDDLTDGGLTVLHSHDIIGTIAGDAGIGTDSPQVRLHVVETTVPGVVYTNYNWADVIIEDSSGTGNLGPGLAFIGGSGPLNSNSLITFGNAAFPIDGRIMYTNPITPGNGQMSFYVNSGASASVTIFDHGTLMKNGVIPYTHPRGPCDVTTRGKIISVANPGATDGLYVCHWQQGAGIYGWGTVTVTY